MVKINEAGDKYEEKNIINIAKCKISILNLRKGGFNMGIFYAL